MSAARAAVVVLCNKWAEYSSLFSRAVDCVLSVTGYYISSRMRIVALKKNIFLVRFTQSIRRRPRKEMPTLTVLRH